MYQKIGILAVLAGVSFIRSTPCDSKFEGDKCSGQRTAQGNQSAGMQTQATQGLPVDTWIKVLKDKNPVLANIEQSPDVKDAIGKIKAMKDPREAVDAFNALQALQQLMALKSAQEAQ